MYKQSDTIIALSSPAGRGAVSIIRMSGNDAVRLLSSCFECKTAASHAVMRVGNLRGGGITDKVMAAVFFAPDSYTGEDVAEIYCHGSPSIVERIISHFVKCGARNAEGGEFTKRAFFSGKLSLDEAEAVCDLINAESDAQINAAYDASVGRLHGAVKDVSDTITEVLSYIEAAIDYPEEDLEEQTAEEAKLMLEKAAARLGGLIATFSDGSRVRTGVRVAIIGSPNAGKSSLLNALLGYGRAIVTPAAGTTRDTIEESYTHKGMLYTLIDTAGLRDADSEAEKEGVRRSGEAAKNAHLVVWLGDTENGFCPKPDGGNIIKVLNKTDLMLIPHGNEINNKAIEPGKINYKEIHNADLEISALTGNGIDTLKDLIYERTKTTVGGKEMLTNARHYEAALRAYEQLTLALGDLASPPDCYAVYLKNALAALGEITGLTASEEVIDRIFSKFCVGK